MRSTAEEHWSAKDAKDAKKSEFIVDPWLSVAFSPVVQAHFGRELMINISALPLLSSRPLRPLRTKLASSGTTEVCQ
jgi:hypothetical protein